LNEQASPEAVSPASGKVAVVIPARLGSQRFPGKVLARDTGKYLIQHVHDAVVGCPGVSRVIVATDSDEVLRAAASFGAEAVLTSPDHASGTDRVAEVARGLDAEIDIIVNVQGDEPLITHADIRLLVSLFEEPESCGRGGSSGVVGGRPADAPQVVMTTLAAERRDAEGFLDPNVVKVVRAADGVALYFSRAPIPFHRDALEAKSPVWFQHIGVYGYRRAFLLALARLAVTPLERLERLEQLRAMENGHRIRVGVTCSRHLGIDTREEYRRFVEEYRRGFGIASAH
jgi:3-deoxy-manno-octulosonate cytidylyltransferase (CMP-KDO synthetase)